MIDVQLYPDYFLHFFTVPRRDMLEKVLERWLNFATEAQDILNVPFSSSEEIPDPYKVGQVLNPFYNDGVNPIFVGRDDIISSIQDTLQKNPHAIFSLTGTHRMGKSSILAHLPIMLGARYIPVNYDISLLIGKFTILNFLQHFIEEIKTHLQRKGLSVQPLELKQLGALQLQDEDDIYRRVDTWLQQIERWLERHRYVLLITFDEVGQLDRRARDTPYFAPLLRWLRNMRLFFTRKPVLSSMRYTSSNYPVTCAVTVCEETEFPVASVALA